MNQGAGRLLVTTLLAALVLGLLVLVLFPDYREGAILDSNRAYMPAVRTGEPPAEEAETPEPAPAEMPPEAAAPAAEATP